MVEAAKQHDEPTASTAALRRAPADGTLSVVDGFGEGGDAFDLPTVEATRYALHDEIGRGGMGRVVRATDRRIGRTIALKLLREKSAAHLKLRFEREARITARLEHPAIVPVYEAGRWPGGEPFYAMKMVSGRSLRELIERATTFEQRLALLPHVVAVADAIAYAHSRDTIHRDLKPGNVIVGDYGETIVIDWGLAKYLGDDEESLQPGPAHGADELTVVGQVMGTPTHMAPEQALGQRVDERADVYALGSILYRVLTGRPPYQADSGDDLLTKLLADDPPSLRTLEPRVPVDLATIVAKAMSREPAGRYPDAAALVKDLKAFHTGQLVASHDYNAAQLLRRWLAKHRVPVAIAAVALAVLAAVITVSVRRVVASAEKQRALLAESYVERGRQAMLDADYHGAQANLEVARRYGANDVSVRMALARIHRAFDTRLWQLDISATARYIAVSSDGRRLAAACEDGVARIYDAESGTLQRELRGHAGGLWRLSFDPQGKRLATSGRDGTARVWDVGSGKTIATLVGHRAAVYTAVFSPDGSSVATASQDGTARVWSASTGAELAVLAGHTGDVYNVVFSPDGERLATVSQDGSARVWITRDGRELARMGSHRDRVRVVAFDRAGRRVATGDDAGLVYVWDAATGTASLKLSGHTSTIMHAVFSPDGEYLLTASMDGAARLWATADGELVTAFVGHRASVTWAEFAAGGRVVTVSADGTARVWDERSGARLALIPGSGAPGLEGAIDERGGRLFLASHGATLGAWRLDAQEAEATLRGHDAWVVTTAAARNGTLLASASDDGTVRLWQVADGLEAGILRAHRGPVNGVAFCKDHEYLVSGSDDGTVRYWRTTDRRLVRTVEAGAPVSRVACAPDGSLAAAAVDDGSVKVWELPTGDLVLDRAAHPGSALAVAFSSRGEELVSTGIDGSVRVWRVTDGSEVASRHAASAVFSAEFSADDSKILVPGLDGSIREWNLAAGRTVRSIDTGGKQLFDVRYVPGTELVVAVGTEGAVDVWSFNRGVRVAELSGHGDLVTSVVPIPGTDRFATSGRDGTVRIWALPLHP